MRGARQLAHGLGMAHLSIDLRAEFRAGVVDGWLAEHGAGLTPNPCVRCNGSVRLDAMLELGQRLGSRTLATGHYARVEHGGMLRMAADIAKDQSYVLSALAPSSLQRLRFPLGDLCKDEVRELAAEAGLSVARKPDSQDLCFLAGTRHGDFLQRHGGLGVKPGPIVDQQGAVLGEHRARTPTPSASATASASARRCRCTCCRPTRAGTPSPSGRATALLSEHLPVNELTLHRDGACVDGVRVRSHGRRFPCRVERDLRAGRHERAEHRAARRARRADRARPGRLPVCRRRGRRLRHDRCRLVSAVTEMLRRRR